MRCAEEQDRLRLHREKCVVQRINAIFGLFDFTRRELGRQETSGLRLGAGGQVCFDKSWFAQGLVVPQPRAVERAQTHRAFDRGPQRRGVEEVLGGMRESVWRALGATLINDGYSRLPPSMVLCLLQVLNVAVH